MDCTKFREIISLYIDEETSVIQREAVEKHIEKCSACKNELANQMKLKDMMKESFSTSVKIDLSASIMQNISKPAEQPKSKIKTLSMVVAAVAAVCILTLATMMSLHVDNDKIAGNEKLEEYVIEHVGGTVSDFNGEVEAVNLEK